jgi:2-hydroxy-3-oxopropionate reductase
VSRAADVAVLGLGAIGLPVAVNAARAGFRVQVWNRSIEKTVRAVEAGATIAALPSDIDARIVASVLPDTPQLDELLDAGLENALRPGDILVVMGTVSPVAIQDLGARLSGRGIHVVDAPVSGGDVGAWEGTLSIMAGGTDEDVSACMPFFTAIGSVVRHLGPLGSGQLAKACNQIVVATTLAALGEAINLARAAGLDDTQVVDILAGGLAGSRALDIKGEKILSGDFTPGGSAVFQLKDLRFALEAGAAVGSPLPVTSVVADLYAQLVDRGLGDLDHSAILRMTEKVPVPEQPV